jgi:hypothetical protein
MYKKRRLGPVLLGAAKAHDHYNAVHAFIGGTGAVGGASLLQMLSMYAEMFSIATPQPEEVPILLATGRSKDEINWFTKRLFRALESTYGSEYKPERIRSGYMTHFGAFVALEIFNVSFLEEISNSLRLKPEKRAAAIEKAIGDSRTRLGMPTESVVDVLSKELKESLPISRFLKRYAETYRPGVQKPYRSVLIGIPIPSLIAYHHDALDALAKYVPGISEADLEPLKDEFSVLLRDDFKYVQDTLADNVMIAHTTGVGGMYDVEGAGKFIRLGFAHAAQDQALLEKHQFADKLTNLYAASEIKTMVTAAAIGIDEIRVRERVPLHGQLSRALFDHERELFPDSKKTLPPEAKASKQAGVPLPARQFVMVHKPATVRLTHPSHQLLEFDKGEEFRPRYILRSGENGFFSVANAEALYRTMRVASASELGHVLASVGLFGDDPGSPWFKDGICYYTETDNSRQVFDFLRQPSLMEMQLTGLEPMALQDLGSSKHQGELHTLALLILLHRLRTLDLDALDPYVDPNNFDAARFFVERSRALTFEDIESWNLKSTAEDLAILASADSPEDLLKLRPLMRRSLFQNRDRAVLKVLKTALSAVWLIPSLGSPIVFNRGQESFMRSGYFVAPLNLLMSESVTVDNWFHDQHHKCKTKCSLETFRDFHICDRGFIDLRPHAIVSSARRANEDLAAMVSCVDNEDDLRRCLSEITPYEYFTTCGLLAILFRLRGLYRFLREGMLELGTFHEWRWQMPRDEHGHIIVLPGAVEAFRMVSEGLDKTTGTERVDGIWGYERRPVPDRRDTIPGLKNQN